MLPQLFSGVFAQPPQQLYSSAQLYPEVLSLDNIEAIQAILCYAMYSLRSENGPSLWYATAPC